jgi:hypothetical protein
MSVTTFGVTSSTLRVNRFPHLDNFSANSAPSATAVSEYIDRAAAKVEGKLLLEEVVAADITVLSAAYLNCARVVELQAAIYVAEAATGKDNGLLQVWRDEVKAFFVELDVGGAASLGSGAVATGDSDPDGPTSHISEYNLTVDASTDMSTTVPRLRRDDQL